MCLLSSKGGIVCTNFRKTVQVHTVSCKSNVRNAETSATKKSFQSRRASFGKVFRSGRPEVFCKKGGLRNFAKFTGKHRVPFLTTIA